MTVAQVAERGNRQDAFSPAKVAGLVRWYAADELHLADGSLVSTWPDRSGNGADLSAAGAARPVLIQDRWVGKPAVVFSAAQAMTSTASGQPTADVAIFAVVANQKRGSSPQFLSWDGTGTTAAGFALFGSSSVDPSTQPPSLIAKASGSSWGTNQAAATYIPGAGDICLLTGTRSGATTKIRVDGGNEVSSGTGGSGALDYSTGTITLTLGAVGGLGYLYGAIFEVLIYNAVPGSADLAAIEAYLDAKWRITKARSRYIALYNGVQDFGANYHYKIGLAWSPDAKHWRRSGAAVITPGTGWKSTHVHAPCLLQDPANAANLICFYNAQGTAWQIGRATSSDGGLTWADYGSNPVIDNSGPNDSQGAHFATVIYDGSWHMWYTGLAGGLYRILYATSSDGLSWTRVGIALNHGGVGAWDSAGVVNGAVYYDGATWHLLYCGFANASTQLPSQGGHATASSPGGPYNRDAGNPIIAPDELTGGTSQALTGTTVAGSRTVAVGSTAQFSAHDQALLGNSGGTVYEAVRILSVDSSTQVTLEEPASVSYAAGSLLRTGFYNKLDPRSLLPTPGGLVLYGTSFGLFADLTGAQDFEASVRWIGATDPSGTWAADRGSSWLMLLGNPGMFDALSAENMSIIVRPGS